MKNLTRHYEPKLFIAFISAIISTITIYLFGLSFVNHPYAWIIPSLFIATILFLKPIWLCLKSLNIYSWLIITFLMLGVTIISWGNIRTASEGALMTLPMILFYLYWSQINNPFIVKNDTQSNKYLFYTDVFFISFAFLISGLITLIIDFNNIDLRG